MIETEDAMPCNNKKGASPKSRPASFRRGCLKGPLLVQLSDSLRNCKKLDANCKKCNSLAIEKGLVFAGNLHHIDTALRNCRWGMGRSNVEAAAAWGNRGVCDGGPNGLHKECRRSSRPVAISAQPAGANQIKQDGGAEERRVG